MTRKVGHQETSTLPSSSVLSMVISVTTTKSPWLSDSVSATLAVVIGEQVLVVAGQDEVGGAVARQHHVDGERRVDHRDDEVGARLAQRRPLGAAGLDAWRRT